MGAQDNTEKVLRSLHVLLSKSEPYPKEPSKVIIDKQEVIDLLAELNTCIYQIMDELTKQGKSIILISTDLPEVIGMSDRVYIMRDGSVVKEISDKTEINDENILQYTIGLK